MGYDIPENHHCGGDGDKSHVRRQGDAMSEIPTRKEFLSSPATKGDIAILRERIDWACDEIDRLDKDRLYEKSVSREASIDDPPSGGYTIDSYEKDKKFKLVAMSGALEVDLKGMLRIVNEVNNGILEDRSVDQMISKWADVMLKLEDLAGHIRKDFTTHFQSWLCRLR